MDPAGIASSLVELVRVAEEEGLVGLRVTRNGTSVAFRRSAGRAPAGEPEPPAPAAECEPEAAEAAPRAKTHELRSRLVGVFRRCQPGRDRPLVSPGDPVREGQLVGYIESMRVMNDVTADVTGILDEFLVGDGEGVDYGRPIASFRVDGEPA